MIWFEFILCSGLLAVFAYRLCNQGVLISEETGIAEGVIGMFFLAVATSFPEIATAVSAVFSLEKVGLGYGDIVGSVIVNSMILVVLDVSKGRGRIFLIDKGLGRLTGRFIFLVTIVILGAASIRRAGVPIPGVWCIGSENIFVAGAYFYYLYLLRGKGLSGEHLDTGSKVGWGHPGRWGVFLLLLVVVMILGVWMANIGAKIADHTVLSQTFTGTLLLGFATSLPEIIVSLAAVRAGSIEMSLGNILGSNLFDLCVLPVLDVFTSSPILGMLSPGQLLATGTAFAISLVVLVGFASKTETKRRVNWDTGSIFVIGFMGFVLLYFVK